jgi:hypothetical protein
MASSPDDAAERSVADAGECPPPPDKVTAVAVRDEHGQPVGILEHWDDAAWIYADVTALEPLEPAHGAR